MSSQYESWRGLSPKQLGLGVKCLIAQCSSLAAEQEKS
jgi:hypothetical protein